MFKEQRRASHVADMTSGGELEIVADSTGE
jgi:hypothetical protein